MVINLSSLVFPTTAVGLSLLSIHSLWKSSIFYNHNQDQLLNIWLGRSWLSTYPPWFFLLQQLAYHCYPLYTPCGKALFSTITTRTNFSMSDWVVHGNQPILLEYSCFLPSYFVSSLVPLQLEPGSASQYFIGKFMVINLSSLVKPYLTIAVGFIAKIWTIFNSITDPGHFYAC